jgi:hypothetical protein
MLRSRGEEGEINDGGDASLGEGLAGTRGRGRGIRDDPINSVH